MNSRIGLSPSLSSTEFDPAHFSDRLSLERGTWLYCLSMQTARCKQGFASSDTGVSEEKPHGKTEHENDRAYEGDSHEG